MRRALCAKIRAGKQLFQGRQMDRVVIALRRCCHDTASSLQGGLFQAGSLWYQPGGSSSVRMQCLLHLALQLATWPVCVARQFFRGCQLLHVIHVIAVVRH